MTPSRYPAPGRNASDSTQPVHRNRANRIGPSSVREKPRKIKRSRATPASRRGFDPPLRVNRSFWTDLTVQFGAPSAARRGFQTGSAASRAVAVSDEVEAFARVWSDKEPGDVVEFRVGDGMLSSGS